MSREGYTKLTPINVRDRYEEQFRSTPPIFWGHQRVHPLQLVSTFRPGHLVIDLVRQVESDKQQVHTDHARLQATQDERLGQAIATSAGPLTSLSESARLERQIAAVRQLTATYQTQLQQARQQANSFFGTDPEHRPLKDFLAVVRQPNAPHAPRQAWLKAYRAAFEAKRLARQLNELRRRQARLQWALTDTRYKAAQRDRVVQLVHRLETKLARFSVSKLEHELARASLEGALSTFQRHQHDDIAAQAAAEHARELERETSDLIRAQNALHKHSAAARKDNLSLEFDSSQLDTVITEQNRKPHAQRNPELQQLRDRVELERTGYGIDAQWGRAADNPLHLRAHDAIHAAFDEQTHLSMLSGQTPSNTPVTFHAWVASTRHVVVLASSSGAIAYFEAFWELLGKALQSAAPRLLAHAATGAVRYASLMLYSARLGNGERMGVSVPLAYMTPGADLTAEANRRAGQTLELALRMNAVPVGEQTEVYLASTDGSSLLRDVRVRQANWDPALESYSFTADGPGGATLLWHPATPPSSLGTRDPLTGSTTPALPIVEDLTKHYPGTISSKREPDINAFPALPDPHIDDYVIVFPADSGLSPIYVIFRDPRQIAGVASGYGQVTPDRFLEAAVTPEGAPIPSRIADKLRGRRFSSFDRLREAFWMEVGADPEFKQHFTLSNQKRVEEGSAPHAPAKERVGKRGTFELHHIEEVARGGAVYSLDNIVVMTPHQHIAHHSKRSKE